MGKNKCSGARKIDGNEIKKGWKKTVIMGINIKTAYKPAEKINLMKFKKTIDNKVLLRNLRLLTVNNCNSFAGFSVIIISF